MSLSSPQGKQHVPNSVQKVACSAQSSPHSAQDFLQNYFEYYATCPKGLEKLLAQELLELDAREIRPLQGSVSFKGTSQVVLRCALWSRLASQIVVVLARIDANDANTLYNNTFEMTWEQELAHVERLIVHAHGTNDKLTNSLFVAQKVKDAILDRMYQKTHRKLMVDKATPQMAVAVRIHGTRATIGLELCGDPLFKRGYESYSTGRSAGSLRADFAAAIVRLAFGSLASSTDCAAYKAQGPLTLICAFPHEATLLIEALMYLKHQAPGLLRKRWPHTLWRGFEPDTWAHLVNQALELSQNTSMQINPARILVLQEPQTSTHGTHASLSQMLIRAGLGAQTITQGDAFCVGSALTRKQMRGSTFVLTDFSWIFADRPELYSLALQEFQSMCNTLANLRATPSGNAVLMMPAGDDKLLNFGTSNVSYSITVQKRTLELCNYDLSSVARTQPLLSINTPDGTSQKIPALIESSQQFAARLVKVIKERAKWAQREDITCYRIYDCDLPDYALSIDLYQNETSRWVLINEFAAPKEIDPTRAAMRFLDSLRVVPPALKIPLDHIVLRTRQKTKGGSQYAYDAKPLFDNKKSLIVQEGGLEFEINFSSRLDCGLFLDHRLTRGMLREMMKKTKGSKRFLNLFAYTGSATCYAADGGARHTTTVDMSKPSLDWARRNMERNGFIDDGTGTIHEYIQADVLRWTTEQRRTPNRWDLIFCDVPTFSNSNKMGKRTWDVQRDHAELIICLSRLLTRDGTAIFSCNLRNFKPNLETLQKAGVQISDITAQTIPHDFERNPKIHHCYLVKRIRQ